MRLIIILIVLCIFGCNSADVITASANYTPKDFVVTGKVKKIISPKVYLYNFYGHKSNCIDSVDVGPAGSFSFKVKKETPMGVYRIILGKTIRSQFMGGGDQYVDFIFNYEDINFETHFEFPYDSMQVLSSNENILYYQYQLKSDVAKTKLDLLMQTLQFYPRDDDFFKDISKQYKKVFKELEKFTDKLISKNKGTILSKIVAFERIPWVDPLLGKDKRNEILRKDFFTKDDFSDTLLLYSDLIPAKVIRFLSFYRNENLHQEAQEAEFIKAVDIILKEAGKNENIYNSVLDYLIEGFEKFDMELTLLHIYDNYVSGGSCVDEERAKSLKDKTDAIKKLGKGQQAPDFTFNDENNKSIKLYDIDAEYTLVLFWASFCSHCTKVIPQIKELYNAYQRNKFEIVAISLDTDKKPWKDYIETTQLKWYNYSNFKGWECPIGRSYYVYGTPTMFLLDKEKKILAKPLNVRDLATYLQ